MAAAAATLSTDSQPFSVEKARNKFPALGAEQVFFDNAGGSQVLGPVIDSISRYLHESNVQLGASYKIAEYSTRKYNEGYEAAANFINAGTDEIVIGPSTTQLFANLSQSLSFPAGSEIILSSIDHEANISAWVRMAALQNLVLKWWTPDDNAAMRLTASNLRPLMSDKTVFVACTHASNILGTIHDIRGIAEVVHGNGNADGGRAALLCVDGVALAPHRAVDVKALGADFYSFSWYKVYGPHNACLYASRSAQTHLHSLGHYFHTPANTLATKLALAGSSYELVSALPSIVSYFGRDRRAAWAAIAAHEERLQGILLEYLNSREGSVTVYGEKRKEKELRVPVVSFSVRGRSSKGVVEAIEKRSGYACRWGHFYSKRLVDDTLGLGGEKGGVVRVSMVHYNTEEEIRGYVKILDEVLSESS